MDRLFFYNLRDVGTLFYSLILKVMTGKPCFSMTCIFLSIFSNKEVEATYVCTSNSTSATYIEYRLFSGQLDQKNDIVETISTAKN